MTSIGEATACPSCGVSWLGNEIPAYQRENYGGKTHFQRQIGIVDRQQDRVVSYRCPDCDVDFPRHIVIPSMTESGTTFFAAQAEIITGDCRVVLPLLPAQSVHCVVTSPPYFGLRDYGVAGQIGLEATPEDYIAELVSAFTGVHRVLRDDGTLWLNLGDSYYNYRTGHNGGMPGQTFHNGKHLGKPTPEKGCPRRATKLLHIKEKETIGIPWMAAFALRQTGWLIRQEIIWSKPNPVPEKMTDRCTRSHEQLFLLTKASHYWFDVEAILDRENGTARRRRSVWTIASRRAPETHFAQFPSELVELCIKAGCPKGGTVLDPFAGTGTVGMVAARQRRHSVQIEINPTFAEIARRRSETDADLFERLSRATGQQSSEQQGGGAGS